MNLLQAIKSGRRFKRPFWSHYTHPDNLDETVRWETRDILADDYIVEDACNCAYQLLQERGHYSAANLVKDLVCRCKK